MSKTEFDDFIFLTFSQNFPHLQEFPVKLVCGKKEEILLQSRKNNCVSEHTLESLAKIILKQHQLLE